MDSKNIIKKYLLGSKVPVIICWVSLLLGILAIVLGAQVKKNTNATSEPDLFSAYYAKDGDYCYFDAVAMTDNLVKYTTDSYEQLFSVVTDGNGTFIVVSMVAKSNSKYTDLRYNYNYDVDFTDVEPMRISGIAKEMNEEGAEIIADFFSLTDEGYDEIFGTYYLNLEGTPGESSSLVFNLLGILLIIVWLVMVIYTGTRSTTFKSCMKTIDANNLTDACAQALESTPELTIGSKNKEIIVSGNFIFNKATAGVVAISTVLWAFPYTQSYNFITTATGIKVGTKEFNPRPVLVATTATDKNGEVAQLMGIMEEKNPDALYGYNLEYWKPYKAMKK